MTGFFYNIRNLFSAEHSGKYLCLLLRELAFQDADSFAKIVGIPRQHLKVLRNHELQVEREWRFNGASGWRRADLAVLVGGEPLVLIEVKEDDVNNKFNEAQLADYLSFVARNKETHFIHLSRYSPNQRDKILLKNAEAESLPIGCKRYCDLYDALNINSPFSKMLMDYLEDIGVASYNDINLTEEVKRVSFFLTQALGFPDRQGLGRLNSKQSVDTVPEIMRSMFGNTEVIGEWLKESNRGLRFTRGFRPTPEFDLKSLRKAIPEDASSINALPGGTGQYVKAGSVVFWTSARVATSADWLNVTVGFGFSIDKAPEVKELPVTLSLYAGFEGRGLPWAASYTDKSVKKFPSEHQAYQYFGTLLRQAQAKALKANSEGIHRNALSSFEIPET